MDSTHVAGKMPVGMRNNFRISHCSLDRPALFSGFLFVFRYHCFSLTARRPRAVGQNTLFLFPIFLFCPSREKASFFPGHCCVSSQAFCRDSLCLLFFFPPDLAGSVWGIPLSFFPSFFLFFFSSQISCRPTLRDASMPINTGREYRE